MFGYESEVFFMVQKKSVWAFKLAYKKQASEPKAKEKCCEAAIIAGGKVWWAARWLTPAGTPPSLLTRGCLFPC